MHEVCAFDSRQLDPVFIISVIFFSTFMHVKCVIILRVMQQKRNNQWIYQSVCVQSVCVCACAGTYVHVHMRILAHMYV